MPSIHQQITLAVAAALTDATAAEDRVYRDRTVPVARDETPCIIVRRVREQKDPASSKSDQALFTLNVCVHVRGEPWTDSADEIAVVVHQTLCRDPQLAALISSIRNSGSEWDDHDADESAGCLTIEYQFRYTLSASDISNSTIL